MTIMKMLNIELKAFCDDKILDNINNDDIDESSLAVKKLHQTKKVTHILQKVS